MSHVVHSHKMNVRCRQSIVLRRFITSKFQKFLLDNFAEYRTIQNPTRLSGYADIRTPPYSTLFRNKRQVTDDNF
jgi:hypothetical protein